MATANAALYCGATVDFVDIDPVSYNMSTRALEEKLRQAARDDRLPKIVIPVHFSGLRCDSRPSVPLAQYGFKIIEDAAHAIGAHLGETKTGDCYYSEITVFSFHPVKIITTGEGGLATSNDPTLARRMQLLRSHGVTRRNRASWNVPMKADGITSSNVSASTTG